LCSNASITAQLQIQRRVIRREAVEPARNPAVDWAHIDCMVIDPKDGSIVASSLRESPFFRHQDTFGV
jgi:hypothetical protein